MKLVSTFMVFANAFLQLTNTRASRIITVYISIYVDICMHVWYWFVHRAGQFDFNEVDGTNQ